jgi:nucleotide sugar dehydrogenase
MQNAMNIVVVGGGKMGLPLACMFANHGANVTVCDKNPSIVESINKGIDPHGEPEQDVFVREGQISGRLRATVDTCSAVRGAHAVVILVSALLNENRDIDWANLVAASTDVAKGLGAGTLVSYETTVPVGGCRHTLIPVLETSGLKAGRDFYAVFSPERVKSRFVFARLLDTPKVIGGFDQISAHKGVEFYQKWLGAPTVNVGSLEAAELVKLAGMIYRDVNIGIVNELAEYAERAGIDLWPILRAANTDGETFLLQPGIGVGGHCTPVYPYFLMNSAARDGAPLDLAPRARALNERQPDRQLKRLERALGGLRGRRIHILGLAFRPQVPEDAYSPAWALSRLLLEVGAVPTIEDPLYDDPTIYKKGFVPDRIREGIDAVVLNTAHPEYHDPDFEEWRGYGIKGILDGRGIWDGQRATAAGLIYIGVGRPSDFKQPSSDS